MSHSTTTSLNPAFPHPLKYIYMCSALLWLYTVTIHLRTSIPLTGEYENPLMEILIGESQAIVTN